MNNEELTDQGQQLIDYVEKWKLAKVEDAENVTWSKDAAEQIGDWLHDFASEVIEEHIEEGN